jgi:DNA polymerase elongation subunit (family B)
LPKKQLTNEKMKSRLNLFTKEREFKAEFGKIVCLSVGYFTPANKRKEFRLKSFIGEEKKLLVVFKDLIEPHFSRPQNLLCGHNAKEFDFPYIARRMLIHRISLPQKLQLFNKKP